MKTLSKEAKQFLEQNGISYYYNEKTDKFEVHYPSDNLEYWDTEEEVLKNAQEYIDFWEKPTSKKYTEIADFFVELYKDELEDITSDSIYEWWSINWSNWVEETNQDVYNEVEKAIWNKINSL